MKKLVFVALAVFLTGCTYKLPVGSFVPYTTSDGQHGWKYGTRGLTHDQINAGISEGVALNKICPSGWTVTSVAPSGDDLTIYEGRCK